MDQTHGTLRGVGVGGERSGGNLKVVWAEFSTLGWAVSGMGEIGFNRMKWYGVVRDLSFYGTRWILKFSFKHRLMNGFKIFKIWLKRYLIDICCNISFKAVFTF